MTTTNKAKTPKQILADIERIKTRMKKERDALRDLIDDAQMLDDSWTDAVDSLTAAADRISELI